jgi:ABC-type antimicrobial peptide transport system permease subunit
MINDVRRLSTICVPPSVSTDRLPNYPILIRTRSKPEEIMGEIETSVASIDPNMMTSGSTLEDMLHRSALFVGSTLVAAIASGIGLFGLLLALMGIYGTISHIVVLRTKEVGIRIAIGAQNRDVLRLILGESARTLIIGLIGGMLLAVVLFVFGARSFLWTKCCRWHLRRWRLVIVLVIGMLASYAPARRAVLVDPLAALRHD